MAIISGNHSDPNAFGFMNNPILQPLDISKDEYVKQTGANEYSYWEGRDKSIAMRMSKLSNADWNGSAPLYSIESPVGSLFNNRQAWLNAENVINQGGNILAFDTETIGDFSGNLTDRATRVAGITEIGFTVHHKQGNISKNYNKTRSVEEPMGSFFFGIDSDQKQWLLDTLEKQIRGEELTNTEASAMERASRHSSIGKNAFATQKGFWHGKEYNFVTQLNDSRPNDINHIRSGIENMAKLYTPDRESQIASVARYIEGFNTDKKIATGYNLAYDVNVINTYAKLHNLPYETGHGVSNWKGFNKNFQYADVMSSLKAQAEAENKTIGDLVKEYNPSVTNARLGSQEAVFEAISGTGFAENAAHVAYEDSIASSKIFTNQGLNVVDKAINLINTTETPSPRTLEDSYIKINSRGNVRKDDILTINGIQTNRYQASNQFWKAVDFTNTSYDEVQHNGAVVTKGQDKFIVKLQAMDSNRDDIFLYKAFNSADEWNKFIENNTDVVPKYLADTELQTTSRNLDIARRVIDGFTDVNQVNNLGGGFDEFHRYYDVYKKLSSLSNDTISNMHLINSAGNEISTAEDMIKNISVGDNISKILAFGEEGNLASLTSLYRTNKIQKAMTPEEVTIEGYDIKYKLQEVFNTFNNHADFYAQADKSLSGIDTNLARTIAFDNATNAYIRELESVDTGIRYSVSDLSNVSIPNGKSSARINIEDTKKGTRRLYNIAKGDSDLISTANLFGIADNLRKRHLLSYSDINELQRAHGLGKQPYALAESIANRLHNNTKELRKLGPSTIQEIKEGHEGLSVSDVGEILDIDSNTVSQAINKDDRTLYESSISEINRYTGELSDNVKETITKEAEKADKIKIISGHLDKKEFGEGRKILEDMGYSEDAVRQFGEIFYTGGKGKSNIARFNELHEIKDTPDAISYFLFKPEAEETSAYLVLTKDRNHAKAIMQVSNLNEDATTQEVKRALSGLGTPFEIPYLKIDNGPIVDTEADNIVKALTGHNPRTTLVKQGNTYRYDTMSLNVYSMGDKLFGNIRDQGDNFLLNYRINAQGVMEDILEDRPDSATNFANLINTGIEAEESGVQMQGLLDFDGKYVKSYAPSERDFISRYTISLDPNGRSMGLSGLLEHVAQEDFKKSIPNSGTSAVAVNAINGIYNAIANDYGYKKAEIYNNEQFKSFYKRNLTIGSGGIGGEQIIRRAIDGELELETQEINALKRYSNSGIIEILSDAIQDSNKIDDSLKNTIQNLATANLNTNNSESGAKRTNVQVGNVSYGDYNNNKQSLSTRPTWAQSANYRYIRRDNIYFDNPEAFEKQNGVIIGDLYTSDKYIREVRESDANLIKNAGKEINQETVSRRGIIGTVQSISNAELISERDASIEFIRQQNALREAPLDEDIIIKMRDQLVNEAQLYEGSALTRPSLYNQEAFTIEDLKTMRSDALNDVFREGTREEKAYTANRLNELVGNRITNGEIIGYRLNEDGEYMPIRYHGQTVSEFTKENAEDLLYHGKTTVPVERQLDSIKIMTGQEKATAKSIAYYRSTNPEERAQEIIKTLENIGLSDQGSFMENKALLNTYYDAAFDALTPNNTSDYKTMVLLNSNISKHITDSPVASNWNLIIKEFNSEEGFKHLQRLAGDVPLQGNGRLLDHLTFDPLYGIGFDDYLSNSDGQVNALDALIDKLRNTDDSTARKILRDIDFFNSNDMAYINIQRNLMNIFEATNEKLDQRAYQGYILQDKGNISKGEGSALADLIHNRIQEGWYDKNIAGLGLGELDKVRRSTVIDERGLLKPKYHEKMLFGVFDALDYANGKLDINAKNIMSIDAKDILDGIPETGGNWEIYKNFIFKVDGKDTNFIKAHANAGINNTNLAYGSNSFYLDLSDYGKFSFNGIDNRTGIVLPFQYIDTMQDGGFAKGKSQDATIRFFNELKSISPDDKGASARIEEALDSLFKAYTNEIHSTDKDSLISKAWYKMPTPNSGGVKAHSAVTPTIAYKGMYDDIQEGRALRHQIAKGLDEHGIADFDLIKQLDVINQRQAEQIAIHSDKLLEDARNLVLTSNNPKYRQYLLGNNKGVIENAVTVSKRVFNEMQMDTGFIGAQVFKDYFNNQLLEYNSRFHRDIINNRLNYTGTEVKTIYEPSKFKILNEDVYEFVQGFRTPFKNTRYQEWADKMYYSMNDKLASGEDKKEIINSMFSEANKFLDSNFFKYDGDLGHITSQEEKKSFLKVFNQTFEGIGERYLEEVGVFGDINRYPNFSENEIQPVRIYLDNTLHGKEVKLLGPQFSLLQNLDFDGDDEYIRMFGNGGLLSTMNDEYALIKSRYDRANKKNQSLFAGELKSSFESYTYGDEQLYKANALKELAPEMYDLGKASFLGSLDEDTKQYIDTLKETNEELYDYIIGHSRSIKDQYKLFNEKYSSLDDIPIVSKMAAQAHEGKNYIGNYSKPNLEIRNTLVYMMSKASSPKELERLNNISSMLFDNNDIQDALKSMFGKEVSGTFTSPRGLLSELEQKGIDTKHIHDIEILNDSTNWRVGVKQLFDNANGASKINAYAREEAVTRLVRGAGRTFFAGEEAIINSDIAKQVAQEITSKSFTEWADYTLNNIDNLGKDEARALLGKLYISSLYEMSQMDNAYEGFHGLFRNSSLEDASKIDIKKITEAPANTDSYFDAIAERRIKAGAINQTDDIFNIYGRRINQGDVLFFGEKNNIKARQFLGFRDNTAVFEDYDFINRQRIDNQVGLSGITIKDLNNQIARKGVINITSFDDDTRNLNIRDFENIVSDEEAKALNHEIASKYISQRLNWFSNNTDSKYFRYNFDNFISQDQQINGYSGNAKIGTLMANIVGEDAYAFRDKLDSLGKYIEYGINTNRITGSEDAKNLIRAINQEIANNPKDNINRFTGDSDRALLENYLEGFANIQDYEFLDRSIDEVEASNQIAEQIQNRIDARNNRIRQIAEDYYNSTLDETVDKSEAFKTARESWEKEALASTEEIFGILNKSTSPREEMINRFGWTDLVNSDFSINGNSDKIRIGNKLNQNVYSARVGYGIHLGDKLSDLSKSDILAINQELDKALESLPEDSLERLAVENTKELINLRPLGADFTTLDFSSDSSLESSYKTLYGEPITKSNLEDAAEELFNDFMDDATKGAKEEADESIKGGFKSFFNSLKESFPNGAKVLKVGGAIAGGAAILGIAGHALFNHNSEEDDTSVPTSIENKSGSEYPNIPSEAKIAKSSNIAPPSVKTTRTIYNEDSGHNFSISAKSKNKISPRSYQQMAMRSGIDSTSLNVSADNSGVTDNWLENKFAELTE